MLLIRTLRRLLVVREIYVWFAAEFSARECILLLNITNLMRMDKDNELLLNKHFVQKFNNWWVILIFILVHDFDVV